MAEDQWENRIEIRSQTSSNIYVVARRKSTGLYECSCPGWKSRRNCKHLREMNLATTGPSIASRSPRSAKPRDTSDFASSKKHYDPKTEGYGDPSQWRDRAAGMVRGRGALKAPVAAAARSVPSSQMAADMALVGITAMPPDADALLAAMQVRADILNDPVTGNPDEFWRMFSAYERLVNYY